MIVFCLYPLDFNYEMRVYSLEIPEEECDLVYWLIIR